MDLVVWIPFRGDSNAGAQEPNYNGVTDMIDGGRRQLSRVDDVVIPNPSTSGGNTTPRNLRSSQPPADRLPPPRRYGWALTLAFWVTNQGV